MRSILLVIIFTFTPAFTLFGQNTAEIRCTVVDRTGGVLPGVALSLTHKGSNQERRQLTDSGGSYVFAFLSNGEYLLRAELSGFKTQIRDGIALQGGQRVTVDVSLEVGA